MNEQIILSMAEPYVKDASITYDQFSHIYSMLSLKEQYEVTEILHDNGIDLVDAHKQIDEESFVLDVKVDEEDTSEKDSEKDDFEILYDEDLFKDQNFDAEEYEALFVNKDIRQSNEILCALIKQGSRQAVQDLCIKNKKLVDKYVVGYQKAYKNRLDFEDLEQAGFIGLIKAGKRFDISLGCSFSTYAVFWIKQCISREIMDTGYVIRIPVHMMERIIKVSKEYNRWPESSNWSRIEMAACELELEVEQVVECLILAQNVLGYSSLNTPIGEEEETELEELIPDENSESVEEIYEHVALREMLENVLESLTDREKKVIRLRFGLYDGKQRTLEEVGKEFNVTRERIRQIEAKALRKLRQPSRRKMLREFLEM